MRERDWSPPRPREGFVVETAGLCVAAVGGLGQTLISGDLPAALAALAPRARVLGAFGLVDATPYAARIARDQALLVAPRSLSASEGWRDGWCATCVDDGWAALDLDGDGAEDAIRAGTSAVAETPSPSSALRFGGLRCLALRRKNGFRLHVESPWREALLTWLAREG